MTMININITSSCFGENHQYLEAGSRRAVTLQLGLALIQAGRAECADDAAQAAVREHAKKENAKAMVRSR